MIRRAVLVLSLALCWVACRSPGSTAEDLPRLGQLGQFSLTDQHGRAVTSDTLRDSIWVAAFMFTRCPTVCPRIAARMRDLQAQAKGERLPVRFVSFSVDPEYDSPEVLRKYAEQHKADLATWSFVTGDHETVKKTSVDGFKLALEGKATEGAEHYGILHGSHLVLVSPGLTIRGYYRTADDAEMKRLLADAAVLAKMEPPI
jgi:protein SCO1/2